MEKEIVVFSLLLLPLLSAFVTLFFLRNSGNIASLLSVSTSAGILVFSLFLIFTGDKRFFLAGSLDEDGKLGTHFWVSY